MLLQIADVHAAQGRAFRIRAGIIPLLIIIEAIARVRLAVASARLGEPGDLPCDVCGNRQFMQCRSVRLGDYRSVGADDTACAPDACHKPRHAAIGASAGGQDEDARFTCAAQDGYRFVRNRAVVPQQRVIQIKRNGANDWLQLSLTSQQKSLSRSIIAKNSRLRHSVLQKKVGFRENFCAKSAGIFAFWWKCT